MKCVGEMRIIKEGWIQGVDVTHIDLPKNGIIICLDPFKTGGYIKCNSFVAIKKRIAVVDAAILKCLKSNG